ncbi:MAG TPA: hypothetical protein PKZ76_04680 [Xanthomonadaceae bacterium]|nr:hypothetical protein [Xanthomonadaceae bacterium]
MKHIPMVGVTLSCALLVACSSEPAAVPEPPDLALQEVPEGIASVVVRHADDEVTFDRVKAVRRIDEASGQERVKLVLTQEPVASEALTDPFESFNSIRWAAANPTAIRPLLILDVDPANPERPLDCELYGPWAWLGGGRGSCSAFSSELNQLNLTETTLEVNVDLRDFFSGSIEEQAWQATGSINTTVVKLDPLPVISGKEALDSPQLARFRALKSALSDRSMAAIEPHVTAESFAELQDDAKVWGEAELLGMLHEMVTEFVDLDPSTPGVDVRLHHAGKRSKLTMERKEDGSTSRQSMVFRWVEGKWLLDR